MDAANRERLPEAHSELVKLLSEKELKDASLLILANKQVPYAQILCCGTGVASFWQYRYFFSHRLSSY
jgi:hypothetical protein